jgi:hypothetical protein
MAAPNQSAWTRRARRLTYFFGAAGTFYLISSYALDRMKEARLRALKDRKDKDLWVAFRPRAEWQTEVSLLDSAINPFLYTLCPSPNAITAAGLGLPSGVDKSSSAGVFEPRKQSDQHC